MMQQLSRINVKLQNVNDLCMLYGDEMTVHLELTFMIILVCYFTQLMFIVL